MNVNDLICVGAEPIAMVDFILCRERRPRGLRRDRRRPARRAPSWPGSRSPAARSPRSATSSPAGSSAGSAIGLVALDAIVDGARVEPGDALIGLPSSGLHSNGYTLARKALADVAARRRPPRPRRSARCCSSRPRSTCAPCSSCSAPTVDVRGLAHITGDGLNNLTRLAAPVGYEIDDPLEVPPVFDLIAELGDVADDEMYEVFNMGCGFVCVVAAADARRGARAARRHYPAAKRIGAVTDRDGVVERGLDRSVANVRR